MTGTLLVTPDTDFEAQVKRAFDGEIDAERWWDPKLPRVHPAQAAQAIAALLPAVVVLGPGIPIPAALELATTFDVDHPEVVVVLVAHPTSRLWERALHCGVREVISPAAEDEEIREALQRAAGVADRRRGVAAMASLPDHQRGRLITVMSPKGGVGKTTVATNLAVSLGATARGRVAIVDLDLQFGDVASALGLTPQSTIADAARTNGDLDSTALKVFLEPHAGGVYLLASPVFPGEADDVSAVSVGQMLDILVREFEYVVVDTASGLDEHCLTAADRSDDLVLVCATDVPSVRGLRKALDAMEVLGMNHQRRHLVLNRADARVGLAARDVETTLGLRFDAAIPSSRSITVSVNQGSPVVLSEPRSPVAKAITTFCDGFLDAPPAPSAPQPVSRRLARREAR
jgi:pilus assembly protein CpaE